MTLEKTKKDNKEELEFGLSLINISEMGSKSLNLFANETYKVANDTSFSKEIYNQNNNSLENEQEQEGTFYFVNEEDSISAANKTSVVHVFNASSKDELRLTTNPSGIRAKIIFSDIKNYIDNLTKLEDGVYSFDFGSYLKEFIPISKLGRNYIIDKKPTGRKFTFLVKTNEGYVYIKKEEFSLVINGEVKKYVSSPGNETHIFSVEPLNWVYHEDDKYAVTKDIIYEIPFQDVNNKKEYTKSLPYMYLKECLLKDLQYDLKSKRNNDKIKDADDLIKKIRVSSSMASCKEEVEEILKNIMYNYNASIMQIKYNQKKSQESNDDNIEHTYINLLAELERLYENLDSYYKEMGAIINTISKCLNILDNKKVAKTDDSLVEMIRYIVTYLLPNFSIDVVNKYRSRILTVFSEEKEKVMNGFKVFLENSNSLKESSLIRIRRNLQPILEELDFDVSENKIATNLNSIISGTYKSEDDSLENSYLSEINICVARIKQLIRDTGSQDQVSVLENILLFNAEKKKEVIDYFKNNGKDLSVSSISEFNLYLLIYISTRLHLLEIELSDYKHTLNLIDSYKIYL